jgi:iron complex outermembrane receptor protein
MESKVYKTSLFISALLGGASPLALSQAQPAETSVSNDEDLSEIVVTARRVEERAQDVPISMTIFNQTQLSDRNIVTSGDLAAATPSMSIDSEFGQDVTTFSIRGFVQALNTTPSVATYFADAVVPRGGAVGEPAGSGVAPGSFFDLQNLQVLKGPQGTLFGRNTDGGAVLLVPKKPTSDFEGYVEGSYGNYAMGEVQGVINFPIGDKVRVRLGVNHESRDGFEQNVSGTGPSDFENLDYTAARASIVVDITPDLENYTVGNYNLSVNNGLLPQLFACNPAEGAGATLCPASLSLLQGQSKYAVLNNFSGAESYLKQYQVINTTTWHATDSLTVKNVGNYGLLITKLDSGLFGAYTLQEPGIGNVPFLSSTSNPSSIGADSTNQYTWSDEVQLSGNLFDSKLTWQAGGYVERSGPSGYLTGTQSGNFAVCPDVAALTCAGQGVIDKQLSTIHYSDDAAYGQATYAILPQLKITGGARYTNDQTTATVNSFNYAGFPLAAPGPAAVTFCGSSLPTVTLAAGCRQNFVQNSNAPTYMVDIDYNPIQDVLVYAKYARGYRQGGVATFVADGYHLYGPEHVNTYELGEKYTFTGPVSGTFDVTGFYNAFSDQQLLAGFNPLSTSSASPSSGIVNAGKSRIWGIEVESTLTPVKPLTLGLSYAYLNTKLQTAFAESPPGGLYQAPSFAADVGGVLPFSPKNKGSANASYRLPVPDTIGNMSVSANYTYTSRLLVSEAAAPYQYIGSYGLLGANIHWDNILRSKIDGELFGNNLTNKLYYNNVTQLYDSPFGLASRYLGEPRMYGVRVRIRF